MGVPVVLYTRVSLADGWSLSGLGLGDSRVLCVRTMAGGMAGTGVGMD